MKSEPHSSHRSNYPWMPNLNDRRAFALVAAAIIVLIMALYWPVGGFDFLNLDDLHYVRDNPVVRNGISTDSLSQAFRVYHDEYWTPVLWLSFMTDVELFGMNPAAMHLVNALIHALNAVLLFLLLWRMTASTGKSALAALLFGLHPLRVESVAWIAQRKDVLSTLFFLMAVGAYIEYVRTRRTWFYAALTLCFVFSLMTKPMLVTMPVLLLLLDLWPLGRFKDEGSSEGTEDRRTSGSLILEKAPLLLVSVIFSITTIITQSPDIHPWRGTVSLLSRVEKVSLSYFIYLRKTIWPSDLAVTFVTPAISFDLGKLIVGFAGLVALCLVAWFQKSRKPYLTTGWYWYVIALFPVTGVIPLGKQWIADRFTYVPHMMLITAAVWLADDLVQKRRTARKIIMISGLCAILVLGLLTRHQLAFWRNSVTLFDRSVTVSAEDLSAKILQADAYALNGKLGEAAAIMEQVIREEPDDPAPHDQLARIYMELGRPEEGVRHFRMALKLAPGNPYTLLSMGDALAATGQTEEAVNHYKASLEAVPAIPGSSSVHNRLGLSLVDLGRYREAYEQFRLAIRKDPGLADAHLNLAATAAGFNRNEEAIFHYQETLRLRPDDLRAHLNYAELLYNLGEYARAKAAYERIPELAPRTAEAHFASGRILEISGDMESARAQYRKGLSAPTTFPELLDTLEKAVERKR